MESGRNDMYLVAWYFIVDAVLTNGSKMCELLSAYSKLFIGRLDCLAGNVMQIKYKKKHIF